MGIYADFLANTKGMDITAPIIAGDRDINAWVDEQIANGDIAEAAAYAAKDEVQSIAIHVATVSGGNFTLTLSLRTAPGGVYETFTTANILWNANAATIETAIDVAATAAAITGWTNADISVSGGDLVTTPVVLTYDGASVLKNNQVQVVITDVDLSGGGTVGAVTTTTEGQSKRTSWAILEQVGAITAGMPYQGIAISQYDLTAGPRDSNIALPSAAVLSKLAEEAGIEDQDSGAVTAIKDALRLVQ